MQSGRLRSLRSAVRKLGTPGELMVEFQSVSEGLKIRRATGINSSASLSPKAEKDKCPILKDSESVRENELSICFTQSIDSNGNLMQRMNTLRDTSRIMFSQISEHSTAQSS